MKRFCIFLFLSCYGIIAHSQWNSDSVTNTVVCNASALQQAPKISSDGNNGCFVVWQDYRSTFGQIYIQKFDADGKAQWAANGIRVCSTGFVQRGPIVASDGRGGAYVVWQDDRNPTTRPDLYAQHVNSDGSFAYGAAAKSIAKVAEPTNDPSVQRNWVMIPDGLGNAYVAWEDSRTAVTPESSRPDIYMTRLWPGGVLAQDAGVSVHNAPARQQEPQLIQDALNRCFMVFSTNYPAAPYGIAATPIDTSLNVIWGTSNNPNIIYRNSSNNTQNSQHPRVTKVGDTYYLAWEEWQLTGSAGWDILAQKLNSSGNPAWFLPATMTPSLTGDQQYPIPNTDYAGGMQVVYQDFQGNKNISSTRILADGASFKPGWPNYLYLVCNLGNDQRNPLAVPTGRGMLVVWEDTRKSSGDTASIFAQVIDTTPSRFFPVQGSRWGFPISTDATARHTGKDQIDAAPRNNGAIVVWRDGRGNFSSPSTGYDIYMQIVFKDATLPIELADFRLTRQLANAVRVDWQTAMEKDNAGFEIERRSVANGSTNEFEVVASYKNITSLRSAGNSNSLRSYSYLDMPPAAGKYEYRLADYSLDGERTPHTIKEIEVGSGASNEWTVLTSMPNPFRERASLSFIAPRQAVVDIEIADQLGRIVATPLRSAAVAAGPNTVAISAAEIGASGTYYYRLTARDPETGNVIFTAKPGVMNLVR